MSGRYLRRWCSPKTILVLMRAFDDPAQVLWAIRQAEIAQHGKLLLAQLCPTDGSMLVPPVALPYIPLASAKHPFLSADSGQSFMWTVILRRAFVLHGISLHEVPGIVRTFKIDRVIATSARRPSASHGIALEEELMSHLQIPVWILGRGMSVNLETPEPPQRTLIPVFSKVDVEAAVRFAWGMGRDQQRSITILHILDDADDGSSALSTTPVAISSWLSRAAGVVSAAAGSIEVAVREGDPAAKILEFDAHSPHDLLLLSRPPRVGRRTSWSMIMSRLCSEMPCPIAVVGDGLETKDEPRLSLVPIRHQRNGGNQPLFVTEA